MAIYKKVLNLISHQEKVNYNYNEKSLAKIKKESNK